MGPQVGLTIVGALLKPTDRERELVMTTIVHQGLSVSASYGPWVCE